MASIHVTVPIVFWGRQPPSHEITCICVTDEDKGIATGSKSGQICIWDLHRSTKDIVLRPRLLLFGSHGSILSLAFVQNWSGDRDRIVSVCDKGIISLWDGKDGTCLKTNSSLVGRHSGIKCLAQEKTKETIIAVWGHYSSIHILDSNTLELICVLKSSHNPNWISQICFIPNVDKNDALAAVTVDGTLKLWILQSTTHMREMRDLFEEKSKALGISQPLTLSSQATGIHTCCIALVVCGQSWELYDATEGRMKPLMTRPREEGVKQWVGGELLSYNMLIAWSITGSGYLYQINSHVLPGLQNTSKESSTAGCILLGILTPTSPTPSPLSHTFASFLNLRWHIIGDNCGRLQVWHIDTVLRQTIATNSHDSVCNFTCNVSAALSDSWDSPALPCSLTDTLYSEETVKCPDITCSLYLTKFGRLICGQSNGEIVVLFANQSATKLLLQKRKFTRTWPQHYFLKGHTGKVTTLLYPSDYSSAYDNNYLLSGGADFSVRLWDLYKGTLVHTFAVHGGDVKYIVTCPPEVNPRLQTCICSIAEDNSVAVLSTSQNKCLLLASCHISPVVSVHWRLEEDFLLVHCSDGRLYVWQIETGTLDRCVDGERAQIILENTISVTKPLSTFSSSPVQVRSLSFGRNHSLVQVILFDPQVLINKLQKMERAESKPRPVQHPSQVRAFRTYISARRNYSITGVDTQAGMSPPTNRAELNPPIPRVQAKAMEAIGDAVAGGQKQEVIKPESPAMTVNIVRLLVSCLHAWNLDESLDRDCENTLGLVRPSRPISFGLLSYGGSLSLVLPGWGLVKSESVSEAVSPEKVSTVHVTESPGIMKSDINILRQLSAHQMKVQDMVHPQSIAIPKEFDQKVLLSQRGGDSLPQDSTDDIDEEQSEMAYHVRWQLSRSLTTQHLLTVVSITNTLMNQTMGAHALASSSGIRTTSESTESEGSSDEDEHTVKDNVIRATWSRVAALHCVMLPERMAGYFRAPHLPVLASRFMDQSQAIREAAQALLQAELRRVGVSGRRELVAEWSGKLQTPTSFSRVMQDSRSKSGEDSIELSDLSSHATPTQQQQITALVILGMIGAEFNTSGRTTPGQTRRNSKGKKRMESLSSDTPSEDSEILDPSIARQTAKTLQAVLLEKPVTKSSLYSSLRCSAAELMGRGFHLWENYVDVSAVIMGLLDLAVLPQLTFSHSSEERVSKKFRAAKFMAEIARRALNLMVLIRPVTVVTAIAKEVSLYLGTQHGTSFPHSSLPPIQVGVTPPPNTPGIVTRADILLSAAKKDILELIRTILEKCSPHVSLQLLDIVDVVLFCLDQDELKKSNLDQLFPSLTRLPNVSYTVKTKRLAVGARSGQVGVYDLKQRKTNMVNAHNHPVTVLCFSEDGKLLATYSYGDSTLSIWHVGSSYLGGVISQNPKCLHSWPAISSSSSSTYSSYVRLEWASSKIIVLYMPGGIEYRYSL